MASHKRERLGRLAGRGGGERIGPRMWWKALRYDGSLNDGRVGAGNRQCFIIAESASLVFFLDALGVPCTWALALGELVGKRA